MIDRETLQKRVELLQLANGAFSSQVLFAVNDIGIFEHLARGSQSAVQLAPLTGASSDALERLLNAAVSLGLLIRRDDLFSNSSAIESILVPGGQHYLGNWIRLMSRWSRTWVHLQEGVISGRAVQDPPLYAEGDPDFARDFTLGMHDYTAIRGIDIVNQLDLTGTQELLDVGGGPGTYAILFAQRWPSLKVTILDLPEVAKVAWGRVVDAEMQDRITVREGDYLKDDYGRGYDYVFISDALQEDPADCRQMLRNARRALKAGGRIVVHDMFLGEDRTEPRWSVMLSLFLLLGRGKGRTYTVKETVDLLRAEGFHDWEHKRLSMLSPVSVVIAHK